MAKVAPGFPGPPSAMELVGWYSAAPAQARAPPIIVLMLVASRSDALGRWKSGPVSCALVAATALLMAVLPLLYLFR